MAVNCFLKIEGPPLEGESSHAGHEGEIDVLSWSWGVTQSGTMHTGAGGGAGKANVQDLHITKHVDSASPNLLQWCCSGKQFEKATLICRKASGTDGEHVPYLTVEMEKLIITSVQSGGSDGQDMFSESLTLNFGQYKAKYTPQNDDGTAGSEIEAGWNIRANEAL
jgi:type VI secretion system secreted protein Hcp